MSKRALTALPTVRLFISYAHLDPEVYKRSVETMLRWQDLNVVSVWSDKDIVPGTVPDERIREELKRMDVFIALLSPHFDESWYIQNVEVPAAQQRFKARKNKVLIAPVVVNNPGEKRCKWLMDLERLPNKTESWAEVRHRSNTSKGEYDLAYQPIRDGLRKIIDEAILMKTSKRP